jgi:hypothetical protein
VHSDGLTQNHQEHRYSEPVSSITNDILNNDLTINETLQLNEALTSKIEKLWKLQRFTERMITIITWVNF